MVPEMLLSGDCRRYGDRVPTTNPLSEGVATWRGALVAAVAAVVAAGIGVGSAVLTSASQDDLAREDFLRQQRQVVYSTFLVQVDDQAAALEAARKGAPDDEQVVLRVSDGFRTAEGGLVQISLLGSPEVEDASSSVLQVLRQSSLGFVNTWCNAHPGGARAACEGRGLPLTRADGSEGPDLMTERAALVDVMRVDLGAAD
jgi:hypothetical protein